jgi:hypothetical protein
LRLENDSLRKVGPRRLDPAITEHRVEFFVLIFVHKILTTMTSCDLADFGELVLHTDKTGGDGLSRLTIWRSSVVNGNIKNPAGNP